MSYTFIFSKRNSTLTKRFCPPLILEDDATYVLGLIDFFSYNTITNIDSENNKFFIGNHELVLEEGTYEIKDIEQAIHELLEEKEGPIQKENYTDVDLLEGKQKTVTEKTAEKQIVKNGKSGPVKRKANEDTPIPVVSKRRKKHERTALILRANRNTFRCEIQSNKEIDFERPGTIANLLGFKRKKLPPNIRHYSDVPINISNVNSICVDCNIIQNSFLNDEPVHIIHMFYPNVAPGYKIIENPSTVIYLPINTRYIDEIVLKIVDQSGQLINFKGDLITIRLHLKKLL